MKEFKENQIVAYINGNNFDENTVIEIGKIKKLTADRCAFVWYHTGETSAKTPIEYLYPLRNEYCIEDKFNSLE